ncbi:hypothetical protein HGA88_02775 [Candidatus Roizmanbacteria bacterium]|nr:hypothetical protein [Candidatus Roizmanbacteria bacterium]
MRKIGYSYSEIEKKVGVSKSTLSNWLKKVRLTAEQKKVLLLKQNKGRNDGGLKRKMQRLERSSFIRNEAKTDIHVQSDEMLKIVGSVLYWAEGAKQKEHNVSQRLCFANSDVKMNKLFLLWLDKICNIAPENIVFELYIHETADPVKGIAFWKKELAIDNQEIVVHFKRGAILTKRKNRGEDYHGLLRIVVKKSTDLNRKVTGWIDGVCEQWGVV